MNRSIKNLLIIVVLLIFITGLTGLVKAESIQYIKIKLLYSDRSFNAFKIGVNITTDVLGNLTYIENYYSVDSYGQPKLYNSVRYDTALNNNSIYFEINRPKDKSGRTYVYSLIKFTVILNKNTIMEEWIPIGSTFKFVSPRNSTKDENDSNITKVAKENVVIIPTPPVLRQINDSSEKTSTVPKTTPGFYGIDIIIAITLTFAFVFKRIR